MLKISIDVKSGIQEFVVPRSIKGSYIEKFKLQYNNENRKLFLQGILLYLMGERISLYMIDANEHDPVWQEKCEILKRFLNKLELKGKITSHSSNFDIMTFAQHRKHGVPIYANYKIVNNALKELKAEDSRLNVKYAPFIKAGLFDVFELPESSLISLLKNGSWQISKEQITILVKSSLNDSEAFDDKNIITLENAQNLVSKLDDIFTEVSSYQHHHRSKNTYLNLIDFFASNEKYLSFLEDKKSGFKLDEGERTDEQQRAIDQALTELEKLTINQIRFSYFMWRYLQMYIALYKLKEKKPQCTSFGISMLNYKNKKCLSTLIEWFDEPLKAFRMPHKDSFSEFYNGVFANSKYGVSTSAPVTNLRYDGIFELFVNTDSATEAFIKKQIANSGRWYLRVGKLCLGRLLEEPVSMNIEYWDEIVDDG